MTTIASRSCRTGPRRPSSSLSTGEVHKSPSLSFQMLTNHTPPFKTSSHRYLSTPNYYRVFYSLYYIRKSRSPSKPSIHRVILQTVHVLLRYTHRRGVIRHINRLKYTPWEVTNTAQGLHLARQVISKDGRPKYQKVVIVITDGYSTKGLNPLPEAKLLRDGGVRIISVGVTNKIRLNELIAMSSPPRKYNEDYFEVPSTETLNAIVSKVAGAACTGNGG